MSLWWLSFCGDGEPGKQFLGACIIEAETFPEAIQAAWAAKLNPGGEVLGSPFNYHAPEKLEKFRGRLLTRLECEAMDAELAGKLQ